MRLYNIYYLCKASYDAIDSLEFTQHREGTSLIYYLENWQECAEHLVILSEIAFLKETIDELIFNIPVYSREKERPAVDSNCYNTVNGLKYRILVQMETIIDLYESLDAGEATEGIDIKIPSCDSFKEYIQYMKDIDFIFSQCPFISQSDEEIVFNTVDVGSMWLSFFIKAQAGKHFILSTIAKLSEIAIKIKSNYTVTKMQDEMLETMKQKNEVGQDVIDIFKKMKDKMLDDAVSEMEAECGMSIDNEEDRDRARRSIDTMATLIDKGLEIYSAIETPEEIKVQFPFTENAPILPDGLQKLIEKKEDIEETEE